MKRSLRLLASCACALLAAAPARAGSLPSGEVLALGASARSLGMAETRLASARGEVSDLARNPLSLHGIERGAMAFNHAFLAAEVSLNQFALGRKAGDFTAGFAFTWLDYGALERRDSGGTLIGDFQPRDMVLQGSLAGTAGPWEWGGSLRWLHSRIVAESSTFAGDFALRRALGEELEAAASVRNLGGKMKFVTESFELPAEAGAGLSWKALPGLRWNLEGQKPFRSEFYLATGAEFALEPAGGVQVLLRSGVSTRTPELGGLAGFHAGFGLAFAALAVDYSFDPQGDLGASHRISAGYRW